VATASPALRRASRQIYREQGSLSTPAALLVSLALAAPGEELFWRGLFQGRLLSVFGSFGAALATLGCYVVVNASSGFLALVAGAVVGGGTWGLLAWWTHGVLAPLLCHAIWTSLMLLRPPDGHAARL
jgi:membrane protease YdiL (CAAX protease family)